MLVTAVGCGTPDANIASSDGTDGKAGPAGPAGAVGPKGDKGDPGLPGTSGERGSIGTAGAVGAAGPKGDIGPAGPAGLPGAAGPKGDTGASGMSGAPGNPGAPGAAGPKGDRGLTGAAGTSMTRSSIYVVEQMVIATSGAMNVAAACKDADDVPLSGSCVVSNPNEVMLFGGSPSGGSTPDTSGPGGWLCQATHGAGSGNASVTAFATCLTVN
jgi:hypothetical protein